jgi:hypothetical protein
MAPIAKPTAPVTKPKTAAAAAAASHPPYFEVTLRTSLVFLFIHCFRSELGLIGFTI